MNSSIPRAAGPSVFSRAGPYGLFLIWYLRTHHANEFNCHLNTCFVLDEAFITSSPEPSLRSLDRELHSTSYSERNNLNVRIHSRRMTRLRNAFSKGG